MSIIHMQYIHIWAYMWRVHLPKLINGILNQNTSLINIDIPGVHNKKIWFRKTYKNWDMCFLTEFFMCVNYCGIFFNNTSAVLKKLNCKLPNNYLWCTMILIFKHYTKVDYDMFWNNQEKCDSNHLMLISLHQM